jgi:hypothetical protein
LKNVFFLIAVTSAFSLGLYSLFLASASADKKQPSNIAGFLRTATSVDAGKINIALGDLDEQDLVYVILYTAEAGPEPEVEIAARRAAQTLSDSSMSVSVRLLDPGDPDFSTIVTQNGVGHFPAVLTVKKDSGIVLVTDKINEKNLLHAYHGVWGKASSCVDAGSTIY